jgi:hypothetical protein
MKKIMIVAIVVVAMLGCVVTAKADSVGTAVPLSFSVPATFGFTLSKYSYDFGTVRNGSGGETTIGMFCGSNHSVVWKLAISANLFTSGADTLPNSAFMFAAWSNADAEQAKGTFITFPTPPAAGMPVPLTPTLFYTSTLAEGADSFVPITLGLYLSIPAAQASGFYTTNLALTMYE